MNWVLVAIAVWLLFGVVLGVLIGRSVRIADARESWDADLDEPNFIVDLPRIDKVADSLPESSVNEAETPLHPPTSRDRSTIPGLPVARPSANRPSVPGGKRTPSDQAAGIRKSQWN
jgi:hypothetical protein